MLHVNMPPPMIRPQPLHLPQERQGGIGLHALPNAHSARVADLVEMQTATSYTTNNIDQPSRRTKHVAREHAT